jgi:hypothetical protein
VEHVAGAVGMKTWLHEMLQLLNVKRKSFLGHGNAIWVGNIKIELKKPGWIAPRLGFSKRFCGLVTEVFCFSIKGGSLYID